LPTKVFQRQAFHHTKSKNPWFTEECKKARKLCQKALRTLKAHPTSTNIEQFYISRASSR